MTAEACCQPVYQIAFTGYDNNVYTASVFSRRPSPGPNTKNPTDFRQWGLRSKGARFDYEKTRIRREPLDKGSISNWFGWRNIFFTKNSFSAVHPSAGSASHYLFVLDEISWKCSGFSQFGAPAPCWEITSALDREA
jgi:hypothetical protein